MQDSQESTPSAASESAQAVGPVAILTNEATATTLGTPESAAARAARGIPDDPNLDPESALRAISTTPPPPRNPAFHDAPTEPVDTEALRQATASILSAPAAEPAPTVVPQSDKILLGVDGVPLDIATRTSPDSQPKPTPAPTSGHFDNSQAPGVPGPIRDIGTWVEPRTPAAAPAQTGSVTTDTTEVDQALAAASAPTGPDMGGSIGGPYSPPADFTPTSPITKPEAATAQPPVPVSKPNVFRRALNRIQGR